MTGAWGKAPGEQSGSSTSQPPILWFLVGVLVTANLGLIGYLVFGGDDDPEQPQVALESTTTVTIEADDDAAATTTTAAPTTTEAAATTTTTTTEAPATTTTTVAPTTTTVAPELPPLDSLPERGAVYRDGKLYLEGAVPDEATAQAFIDRATEVIGAENVVNNYIVRNDAPIPTDGNVRVEQAVLFQSGSAVIAEEFEPILGLGVAVMNLNPQVRMIVEGHTDDVGSDLSNLALSQRRAEAAVNWMVANGGIDISRFEPVGFGEAQPVTTNETAGGRQVNRRIEVQLIDLLLPEG